MKLIHMGRYIHCHDTCSISRGNKIGHIYDNVLTVAMFSYSSQGHTLGLDLLEVEQLPKRRSLRLTGNNAVLCFVMERNVDDGSLDKQIRESDYVLLASTNPLPSVAREAGRQHLRNKRSS